MPTWQLILLVLGALVLIGLSLLMFCGRYARADWGNAWLNRLDGLNQPERRLRFHASIEQLFGLFLASVFASTRLTITAQYSA